MNEPIWLTAADAAIPLGVHVTTVRRRGHAGTIETRVGEDGVTLYRVDEQPAQWRYNHQYQEWRYEDPDGSRRVVGYPVTFSWFASYSDACGCRSVVRCDPGTAMGALRDDATGTSSIHAFISAALDAAPEVFATPEPEPAPAQWRYCELMKCWRYDSADESRWIIVRPPIGDQLWRASYCEVGISPLETEGVGPAETLLRLRALFAVAFPAYAFISAALDAAPASWDAPTPEPEPKPEPAWINTSTGCWQYEDGGNVVDVWSTTTGVVARYHGSDGLDRRFSAVYAESAIEHLVNWLGDHGHDTIVPCALACLPDELRAPTTPPEVTWRYDVPSRVWQAQGDQQSLRVRRLAGGTPVWIVEHYGPDGSAWSNPDPARALESAESWAENHREHKAFITAARACAPRAFEIPEVTWQPGIRGGSVWVVADDLRVELHLDDGPLRWRAVITRPPTQSPRAATRPTAQGALRALAEDTTDAYDRAVLEAALVHWVGNSGAWQAGAPPFEAADWHGLPRSQHHRTAARPDALDTRRDATLGRCRWIVRYGRVDADPPPSPPVGYPGGIVARRHFTGQDLRNADFVGACIEDCDFTDARLDGAKFTGASLDRCRGLRYASVSVPWHGEFGRSLVAVDHGSEGVIYHCGCFRGPWDALVEWIESHDEDLAGSRMRVARVARDLIEEAE